MHELSLFMEDTVWPDEDQLETYVERSGNHYLAEMRRNAERGGTLLTILARLPHRVRRGPPARDRALAEDHRAARPARRCSPARCPRATRSPAPGCTTRSRCATAGRAACCAASSGRRGIDQLGGFARRVTSQIAPASATAPSRAWGASASRTARSARARSAAGRALEQAARGSGGERERPPRRRGSRPSASSPSCGASSIRSNPASARMPRTRSGSPNENGPGAPGGGGGGGVRKVASAANGTVIHGFSGNGRQHTNETPAAAAQRAAQVRERARGIGEEHHAEARVDAVPGAARRTRGSARRRSRTRRCARPASRARSRARASITAETSTPSTRPPGPTRRASASVVGAAAAADVDHALARGELGALDRELAERLDRRVDAVLLRDPLLGRGPSSSTRSAPRSDRSPRAVPSCTPHGLRSPSARCARLAARVESPRAAPGRARGAARESIEVAPARPQHRSEAREVVRVLLAVDQLEAPALRAAARA